jgi:hypothetical protein
VPISRKQDAALRKRSKAPRKRSRQSALAKVFLSHVANDRPFVDKLAKLLREYGVPVWYSSEDLVGAQQWHDRIGGALRKCRWFVLVLSPEAVRSRWVKRELMYALDDPRYEERIIPVLYRNCDSDRLSWVLRAFQRVDFTVGFGRGAQSLLRVWGKGYTTARRRR